MKNLTLALLLVGTSASAGDIKISQFSVIRQGGGQIEVVVRETRSGVIAYTKSCNFKDLDTAGITATTFTPSAEDARDASRIIANEAILASEQSVRHPYIATGSWSAMSVTYTYTLHEDEVETTTKEIQAPLVLIDGKISNVLDRIEDQARRINKEICK